MHRVTKTVLGGAAHRETSTRLNSLAFVFHRSAGSASGSEPKSNRRVVKRVVRRVVGSGSLICFPSTWFLTLAIIATWSAVAVITFDLVNFHTYLEPICDGPCPLPGKQKKHPSLLHLTPLLHRHHL
uniref:Aspartyl beta-hydroxylase/Triadin domain-containing protein n=1 Tax=Eptatretus burgeri TaxID=7764 RepID=A0A8C4N6C7_EPTBU